MTQPQTDPDRTNPMTHREILAVLSGLMLGMFLAALDQSIVGTALKTIVTDLGGAEHVSWVVAAYLITSTVSTPLYGKLSDLYGRKPVYQVAIGIFVLGSILAGFSQSMVMLILARAVQGLGGGGLLSLAFTIIGDMVSPRERGKYQGYFGAVFGLSSVAGPLLGGLFTDTIGWHWIFFVNVPIGVLAWLVVGARLNLPFTRRDHHLDYLGALTLVAGVSALLLVTQWAGQEYAWGSGQIIGLSALAVLLLVAFVLVERRSPEPILPLRLFRNRTFSLVNGAQFIIALGMFGAIIYVPFYLQLVRGYSATGAGLLMIPVVGGILVTSISSGQAISRYGRWKPFPVAGTAIFTVGLALTATLTTTTPVWLLAALPGGDRRRARPDHADAGARGAERQRPVRARGGHLLGRLLPQPRRRDRHRRLRGHRHRRDDHAAGHHPAGRGRVHQCDRPRLPGRGAARGARLRAGRAAAGHPVAGQLRAGRPGRAAGGAAGRGGGRRSGVIVR